MVGIKRLIRGEWRVYMAVITAGGPLRCTLCSYSSSAWHKLAVKMRIDGIPRSLGKPRAGSVVRVIADSQHNHIILLGLDRNNQGKGFTVWTRTIGIEL